MASVASDNQATAVSRRRTDTLFALVASLAGLALYVWHCSPVVRFWDAAERALVAFELGLSHPTGCFLHGAVGKVFLTVAPLPADYAMNLLSALAGALTLAVVYRLAREENDDPALCLAATLVLATSALFWSQAVYSEVYMVHLLFVALFLLYYMRWLKRGDLRTLCAAAFLLAVGMGIHVSTVLLAPWIAVGVLVRQRAIFRSPRRLLAVAGAVALGLTWLAAVYIRGRTYCPIGTAERPDTLGRLVDFMTASQYAGGRHPPVGLLARRVAASFTLLAYSVLGVGALVALWGWIRMLRPNPALAVLAGGGTITYIVYFSDNLTSDVGTLILPCSLFLLICMVAGWGEMQRHVRRPVVVGAIAALAAVQAIVFPILTRKSETLVRGLPAGVESLDGAGPRGLFWEGVLKARVSFRRNFEPRREAERLAHELERQPGPKVLLAPWEVQTVLAFYRATENWLPDVRVYELMAQRRFYRAEAGSAVEVFDSSGEIVETYIGRLPVFVLVARDIESFERKHTRCGSYWFDDRPFHLFRLRPPPSEPPPPPTTQ
jgi:hypothetical protein